MQKTPQKSSCNIEEWNNKSKNLHDPIKLGPMQILKQQSKTQEWCFENTWIDWWFSDQIQPRAASSNSLHRTKFADRQATQVQQTKLLYSGDWLRKSLAER